MAPSVSAVGGTSGTAKVPGKNVGYTDVENMMITKAFIAASEDPIKGNYQTAAAIAETVYTNYVALCVEQTKLNHLDVSKLIRNEERGTKAAPKPTTNALERPPNNTYKVRSSSAAWTQFKTKIAKECMHYGGIVTANALLLGDTEADSRDRCLSLYKMRDGTPFKFLNCWEFLKDNPKWKVFRDKMVNEIGVRTKMGRPIGSKKAKKEKAIDLTVEREVERVVSAEKAKEPVPTTNSADSQPDFLRAFTEQMVSFSAYSQSQMMLTASPDSKARIKREKDLMLNEK
jgi:hypothetical protein